MNHFKLLSDHSHSNGLGQSSDGGAGAMAVTTGKVLHRKYNLLLLWLSMTPLATCGHCHRRDPRGEKTFIKIERYKGENEKGANCYSDLLVITSESPFSSQSFLSKRKFRLHLCKNGQLSRIASRSFQC